MAETDLATRVTVPGKKIEHQPRIEGHKPVYSFRSAVDEKDHHLFESYGLLLKNSKTKTWIAHVEIKCPKPGVQSIFVDDVLDAASCSVSSASSASSAASASTVPIDATTPMDVDSDVDKEQGSVDTSAPTQPVEAKVEEKVEKEAGKFRCIVNQNRAIIQPTVTSLVDQSLEFNVRYKGEIINEINIIKPFQQVRVEGNALDDNREIVLSAIMVEKTLPTGEKKLLNITVGEDDKTGKPQGTFIEIDIAQESAAKVKLWDDVSDLQWLCIPYFDYTWRAPPESTPVAGSGSGQILESTAQEWAGLFFGHLGGESAADPGVEALSGDPASSAEESVRLPGELRVDSGFPDFAAEQSFGFKPTTTEPTGGFGFGGTTTTDASSSTFTDVDPFGGIGRAHKDQAFGTPFGSGGAVDGGGVFSDTSFGGGSLFSDTPSCGGSVFSDTSNFGGSALFSGRSARVPDSAPFSGGALFASAFSTDSQSVSGGVKQESTEKSSLFGGFVPFGAGSSFSAGTTFGAGSTFGGFSSTGGFGLTSSVDGGASGGFGGFDFGGVSESGLPPDQPRLSDSSVSAFSTEGLSTPSLPTSQSSSAKPFYDYKKSLAAALSSGEKVQIRTEHDDTKFDEREGHWGTCRFGLSVDTSLVVQSALAGRDDEALKNILCNEILTGCSLKAIQVYDAENCVICLDDAPDTTLHKCGHQCVHRECFEKGDLKDCLVCRSPILAYSTKNSATKSE